MRRLVLVLLAALVLAGCTSRETAPVMGLSPTVTPAAPGPYSPPASPGAGDIPGTPAASAAPLQTAPDVATVTGTITGPCHYRGTAPLYLPDPRCTPGSYDPALTAKKICASGYDVDAARPPPANTTRFKYEVAYPAYGVPQGTKTELDHLVPRGLGGNNTAANLWPQSPPTPNSKDATEDHLRDWVCAAERAGYDALAEARLAAARQVIAADWITAIQVLGAFN